jgi:hypothetical protein
VRDFGRVVGHLAAPEGCDLLGHLEFEIWARQLQVGAFGSCSRLLGSMLQAEGVDAAGVIRPDINHPVRDDGRGIRKLQPSAPAALATGPTIALLGIVTCLTLLTSLTTRELLQMDVTASSRLRTGSLSGIKTPPTSK